MKIINLIIEILTSPFVVLFRANAKPNPNKIVKPLLVLAISLAVVAVLFFIVYYEVIFKWYLGKLKY